MSSPSQPLHRTCAASPSWYLGRPRPRLRALPSVASSTSCLDRKAAAHWAKLKPKASKSLTRLSWPFRSPNSATKSARSVAAPLAVGCGAVGLGLLVRTGGYSRCQLLANADRATQYPHFCFCMSAIFWGTYVGFRTLSGLMERQWPPARTCPVAGGHDDPRVSREHRSGFLA